MVTDRLKLSADAAWLPWISYGGYDNHWARPDINPMKDRDGKGNNGWQLQAVASYRVTDRMSVGMGVRHMEMRAKGNVVFPGNVPSATKLSTQRTTFFLQASYAIGGSKAPPVLAKY
jgi:hypothetical protein